MWLCPSTLKLELCNYWKWKKERSNIQSDKGYTHFKKPHGVVRNNKFKIRWVFVKHFTVLYWNVVFGFAIILHWVTERGGDGYFSWWKELTTEYHQFVYFWSRFQHHKLIMINSFVFTSFRHIWFPDCFYFLWNKRCATFWYYWFNITFSTFPESAFQFSFINIDFICQSCCRSVSTFPFCLLCSHWYSSFIVVQAKNMPFKSI